MNSARRRSSAAPAGREGFTLVELLVVIGIIAILLSILLPVIGRVRAAARTTKCAANLRSIGQTLAIYVAEQRGSYPWGWTYDQHLKDSNALPGAYGFKDWVSTVAYYGNRKRKAGVLSGNYVPGVRYREYTDVFVCPEVDTSTYDMATSYQGNPAILVDQFADQFGYTSSFYPFDSPYSGGGVFTRWIVAPARANQLYPDNAILWDTQQMSSTYVNTPDPSLVTGSSPDFLMESFIDYGTTIEPALTVLRFRPKGADPFEGDPDFAGGDPIWIPGDGDFGDFRYNADFPPGTPVYNLSLGGARFRHNRESVCNVLFADNSVRGLSWDKAQRKPRTPSQGIQNEFIRNYLRIKPTPGVPLKFD